MFDEQPDGDPHGECAAEIHRLEEALRQIGDFAHDKSTGPAVPDALWEVRSMAYDALRAHGVKVDVILQCEACGKPTAPGYCSRKRGHERPADCAGNAGVGVWVCDPLNDTQAELDAVTREMDVIYERWPKKDDRPQREELLTPLRTRCVEIGQRRYHIAAGVREAGLPEPIGYESPIMQMIYHASDDPADKSLPVFSKKQVLELLRAHGVPGTFNDQQEQP